jgi:hypothetical protein
MADEIIKELWKIKDDIAKEYGCDLKAFVSILRAKKQEDDQQPKDETLRFTQGDRGRRTQDNHSGGERLAELG